MDDASEPEIEFIDLKKVAGEYKPTSSFFGIKRLIFSGVETAVGTTPLWTGFIGDAALTNGIEIFRKSKKNNP